jgi:AraC-like DNA-binding protein
MEQVSLNVDPRRLPRTPRASQAKVLRATVDDLSDFLGSTGVDPGPVFRAAGLDQSVEGKLDLPRYCALLELAARQTGNDVFGLQYGHDVAPERLGLIGGIALASPTLGIGLANLVRFFPYHHQNTEASFRQNANVCRLEYRILDGRILQHRQEAELTMSILLTLIRRCVGKSWAPDEVHFEHPQPEGTRMHRQVFNAPVYFSMGTNALVFRDPDLRRPMPDRNAARLQNLCETLVRLAGGTGVLSLTDQVAGEIRSRLPSGYPHIEIVADALRMTRWTLQRRLAEHGQVFSNLVEATRRSLAELYLGTAHMPIREIANVLGYSELSAFTRASVRWFGEPPSRVRERILRQKAIRSAC